MRDVVNIRHGRCRGLSNSRRRSLGHVGRSPRHARSCLGLSIRSTRHVVAHPGAVGDWRSVHGLLHAIRRLGEVVSIRIYMRHAIYGLLLNCCQILVEVNSRRK
jgi:hypothetical protein